MKTELRSHNIFVVGLSGTNRKSLLYAPLADVAVLVDEDDINPTNLQELIAEYGGALLPSQRLGAIHGYRDFVNLSILPNNTCNFNCSYCYSSQERGRGELSLAQATAIADDFIDTRRNPDAHLTFSIFGGGEPMLPWERLTRPLINHIHRCMGDRPHTITLITNGSVIPDDFAEICRQLKLDLVVSFDILPEIQNLQRRHYDLVAGNIRHLLGEGVNLAINSVITQANVDRQCEMIEELATKYKGITYASFEPVMEKSGNNDNRFYNRFGIGFERARQLAASHGITLSSTILRNADVSVERYCPGELAVVANGDISSCPCVSSPLEPNYGDYVYGRVDENGKISIDSARLDSIIKRDVDTQLWCRDCWARFNCGGGCINKTAQRGGTQDAAYCRFVRNFLKYTLCRRLDEAYAEEGIDIKQEIGDYERFITE